MIRRDIRYQAAVLQEGRVLLAQMRMPDGHTFWLPPGGGREGNETPEETVRREIFEETNLHVNVERLLFIEPDMPEGSYDYLHTYLCHPLSGNLAVGVEPEVASSTEPFPQIHQLEWFDLNNPSAWEANQEIGAFNRAWLNRVRKTLKSQ